jgi:site-specific DNA recombinase
MRKPDRPKATQILRCAIYTRKSSDDGLEQEFNSLDAQRDACEAYVTSQRHAGWIALPDMYDDGGLSRRDDGAAGAAAAPHRYQGWQGPDHWLIG